MSNMSYCRFENTASDLRDCYHNLDGKLSEDENLARKRLLNTCLEMLEAVGVQFVCHNSDHVIQEFCATCQEQEEAEEED